MAACDDPTPDCLIWGELAAALEVAIGSGGAGGLQITIYNPDFDQSGANGRGLATKIDIALSEFTWLRFAVKGAIRPKLRTHRARPVEFAVVPAMGG